MKDSHGLGILTYSASTSLCAYKVEPPYTERYVRWCERLATQIMGSLLLDYNFYIRKFLYCGSLFFSLRTYPGRTASAFPTILTLHSNRKRVKIKYHKSDINSSKRLMFLTINGKRRLTYTVDNYNRLTL